MRPKLEKDGKDKILEVDSEATLEQDYGSTRKTWKETSEVSKEGEADHKLEKASQEELGNHNQELVKSQGIET